MLQTKRSYNGMVVAPHHLASQAGLRVLREGGNAVEAMIAAASTIAVVYPHMNNLGGDNFWLLYAPGKSVMGIDACGAAAGQATQSFYKEQGYASIPDRGPLAALTMAGAVSGWQAAFEYSQKQLGGRMPLTRLLEDAIDYARNGVAVTQTLANNIAGKREQLEAQPGYADCYIPDGRALLANDRLRQTRVSDTLQQLTKAGLDDFYHGDLATSMARELEASGSPLRIDDFNRHKALWVEPLTTQVAGHALFNLPPPTQGLASLLLLGVHDRLKATRAETSHYVHSLVEATKCAFRVRDKYVTDPAYMKTPAADYLEPTRLDAMAAQVNPERAAPWPDAATGGDTVWLGAIDNAGRAVSFIQSVYWEFGSGVVLPSTGITWQNRGISFSLDADHHNALMPHRRPFHTIQPALAILSDGRVMSYGTMGGEGQPQTQAMVFTRHVIQKQSLQTSISAPRWLLGRTWGSESTNLRIENRFDPEVYEELKAMGHDVEIVGSHEEIMGHAGALVHHPDGLIEAAADPRSDGSAVGF
ncbi:MAG: gamma-glutamyltransferase family protein [Granulosicoccus sp.]